MTQASADIAAEPRTVIVTGAGSGIGRGIARRLMQDGYQCVLAGPVIDQLQATTVGVPGGLGTCIECDVRSGDGRRQLIAGACELPGRLHGLVNNAAVSYASPLLDDAEDDWDDTLRTNVQAAHLLAVAAAESMRSTGGGRIVNIASIRGFRSMVNADYEAPSSSSASDRGPIRATAYAASKAALIQATMDLAVAVGPWGINVNAVSPGLVLHPSYDERDRARARRSVGRAPDRPGLGDRMGNDVVSKLVDRIPLRRAGGVAEIAGPVAFLLSEDAGYVSGAHLVVDGAWTAG